MIQYFKSFDDPSPNDGHNSRNYFVDMSLFATTSDARKIVLEILEHEGFSVDSTTDPGEKRRAVLWEKLVFYKYHAVIYTTPERTKIFVHIAHPEGEAYEPRKETQESNQP